MEESWKIQTRKNNSSHPTLAPPWQRLQKVMSLGIVARMLKLPGLIALLINPGFVQTWR